MLTITAWKDNKKEIAFVLAACSILLGLISLVRLKSDRDGGPPEAEGHPNGSP
jgi:hypothetical protein